MKSLIIAYLSLTSFSVFAFNTFIENGPGRRLIPDWQSRLAPYKWIGKLKNPANGTCTASVIGKDLILTAGHCINSGGGIPFSSEFSLTLSGLDRTINFSLDEDNFTWGVKDLSNLEGNSIDLPTKDDYAIIRLPSLLPSNYGYFSLSSTSNYGLDSRSYSIAGYGKMGNELLTALDYCSIKKVFSTELYHSCDSSPGDSGAPIYEMNSSGGYVIKALHSKALIRKDNTPFTKVPYSDTTANIATPASLIKDEKLFSSSASTDVYPYGKFEKIDGGFICYLYCEQGMNRIGVTLMDYKNSKSKIENPSDCQRKALKSCPEVIRKKSS